MPYPVQSISQSDLDNFPFSEIIEGPINDYILEAKNFSKNESTGFTLGLPPNESQETDLGVPLEIAEVYPNLQLHSIIGESIRYQSIKKSADAPLISVYIAPKSEAIHTPKNDEGFSDLPILETNQGNENNEPKAEGNDGFEDIPLLATSDQPDVPLGSLYPSLIHEAQMIKLLGDSIGVSIRTIQTIGRYDVVESEMSVGIPLMESFRLANSSEKKLQLLRSLVHLAKDLHSKGYALEGAEIHDFVVSDNKVWLANLSAMIPMAGSRILPLKIDHKIAPELLGHSGQRTLGGILYGLGLQFLSLASGESTVKQIEQVDLDRNDWTAKVQNLSPELARLLGSLLAKNPESRLGLYQEIGEDEIWNRLENMISDWINSANRPKIHAAGATTIGVYRENNEDAFAIVSATKRGLGHGRHLLLGMVSDGMGGGAVGEIASTITIESLSRSFTRATEICPDIGISSLKLLPEGGYLDTGIPRINPDLHIKAMADALIIAHYEVKEAADKGGESCGGMGATAVAIHFSEWDAVVGHVGDSRAYLVRNGTIKQLTTDHSAVQKMVAMGLITPTEAENHSRRHELSQAIGGFEEVVPDVASIRTMPGDCLFLCTDGVTNVLNQDKLMEFLSQSNDPETIANNILAKVNCLGAPDNATALVIQIK